MKGAWDSIHVFECQDKAKTSAHYKLTSTVMLNMITSNQGLGSLNLSGSMTRQVSYRMTSTEKNFLKTSLQIAFNHWAHKRNLFLDGARLAA